MATLQDFPWLELAVILAIGAALGTVLVIAIRQLQRQRYLRRWLPWCVRSIAIASVLSFLVLDWTAIAGYLLFIVLPIALIIGSGLGILSATITSVMHRSLAVGFRISCRMVEGSILMAIIVTAIICHFIGVPMVEELAYPDVSGDNLIGVTYSGLVLVCVSIPASFIGSIVGGLSTRAQR
ncbi:MAG: hypothetical protein AAFY17_15375 [Cyanobacteria bacterium J06642_11]